LRIITEEVNFVKKILLSVLITCALVFMLLSHIDFDKAVVMFKSFPLFTIIWLFFVYGLYLQFTALRFNVLLGSKTVGLKRLFIITAMHNMYNRVLPFRTGEVSYILLLRAEGVVTGTEAAASLLVARIFDYLTISFLFVLTVFFMRFSGTLQLIAWVMAFFMAVAFGALAAMTFGGHKFFDWFHRLTQNFEGRAGAILQKAEEKGREGVESLQSIGSKSTYGRTFLFSLLIWLAMFYIHYAIISGLGESPITYWGTIIGSTFAVLTNILPIHGVAGFGTIETGWTVGYMLLGIPKQVAIGSGFLMHLFVLFSALVYGLIALAVDSLNKTRKIK